MPIEGTSHIVAPVSLADVATVLGEPTTDMDLATLCTSDKIHKWARCKPYRIITPEEISDEDRKDAHFGLSLPEVSFSTKAQLIASLNADGTEWGYVKPDDTCFKRLTDFDNYDHKAPTPFGTLVNPNMKVSEGDELIVNAIPPMNAAGEDEAGDTLTFIKMSELDFLTAGGKPISQFYYGVLLRNTNSTKTSYVATGNSDFSTGADQYAVSFGKSVEAGNYDVIPFISSAKIAPGENPTFDAYGIEADPSSLAVLPRTSAYFVSLKASRFDSNYISVHFSIKNNTSAAVPFTGVRLWVAKDNVGQGAKSVDTYHDGEPNGLFDDATIRPGASHDFTDDSGSLITDGTPKWRKVYLGENGTDTYKFVQIRATTNAGGYSDPSTKAITGWFPISTGGGMIVS